MLPTIMDKMRIVIASFLSALLCQLAFSQSDTVLFFSGGFNGAYSQKFEQPLWIEYEVNCSGGDSSRDGLRFYKNDSIHTSDDLDYYKNVWDRGHLAPAANFKCSDELMSESFSYLNCALQHQSLNRGEWKELEEMERALCESGFDVDVRVEVFFTENDSILPTGARIPEGFFKMIETGSCSMCFYFPNEKADKNYMFYRIFCPSDLLEND